MTNRETFLNKFNRAFVENDLNYIFDSVTEDVYWEMIGDQVITGKKDLIEVMNKVKEPRDMTLALHSMIIDKDKAAVHGSMKMKDSQGLEKFYAFCDLYTFSSSGENKIRELRAFIIEIPEHGKKKD